MLYAEANPWLQGEKMLLNNKLMSKNGEIDNDAQPAEDVDAVLTMSGSHNGYLLCRKHPTRPCDRPLLSILR